MTPGGRRDTCSAEPTPTAETTQNSPTHLPPTTWRRPSSPVSHCRSQYANPTQPNATYQQICFTLDARLNQHQNLDLGLSLETKRLSSVSMPEFWFRLRPGGHNFGLGLSPGQNIGLGLGLERLVSRLTSLVAVVAALVCPCRSQYG